ncbi:hypothetical protein FRC01_011732, partial [Tulasnella sp. 417]
LVVLASCWSIGLFDISINHTSPPPRNTYACHPPLPPLLKSSRSPANGPPFSSAAETLDAILSLRASAPDIDSISLAVVTPSGTVFSKSYGVLKANETNPEKRGRPDEDSLYRIASISKMFTVFELMVLKEKGLVSWDDPVSKYLQGFTHNQDGWRSYISETQLNASGQVSSTRASAQQREPITLRQLASHMAGIGLDYPPIDASSWPKSVPGDLLWLDHAVKASQAETLRTIRDIPLVAPPYTLPAYSNAGFNVLGWALAAAAGVGPEDYAMALQRDIFQPLGLSSGFSATKENSERVAVSSKFPFEVDYDVGSYNPSAGQFSSLRDLITVMQTFLDPSRNNSLLSPYSMREWLRPLHGFPDDFSEIGAPWEIVKIPDSNGNTKRWYSGNFLASNSNFIFDPVSSFGVVVLMTGQYRFALELAIQAIQ